MGHKDLKSLHLIYEETKQLSRENHWYFNFKVDDGDYETRIDIAESGLFMRGNGKLPLQGYEMKCPDLIDFSKKTIIEFEESAKKSTGYFHAEHHKGHTEYTNTRDTKRDHLYDIIGFSVLKIWDWELKDGSWKEKLRLFLEKTHQSFYPGMSRLTPG